MNLPETIQVTIPAQEYKSEVYDNTEECYLAIALKELGYTDIRVLNHGETRIEDSWYKPEKNFNSEVLQRNFRSGINTVVNLIKQ